MSFETWCTAVYGRFSEGSATADLTAARRLLGELEHDPGGLVFSASRPN